MQNAGNAPPLKNQPTFVEASPEKHLNITIGHPQKTVFLEAGGIRRYPMARIIGFNCFCLTLIALMFIPRWKLTSSAPTMVEVFGRCPDPNQSENLNSRCRLSRSEPISGQYSIQCSSATAFDIRQALVQYAGRRCVLPLSIHINSPFANDTLDMAEDTFEALGFETRVNLYFAGLTWVIPRNWNEISAFNVSNQIRHLQLFRMNFIAPDGKLPADLFLGLDKVERVIITDTELPVIESGFFDVMRDLRCLKLYNVSIPCTCEMRWFYDWMVEKQFSLIFNGNPQCGIFNTNCYLNGLDGVWFFSPDVDATMKSCKPPVQTIQSRGMPLPQNINTQALLEGDINSADNLALLEALNGEDVPSASGRADFEEVPEPVSLECRANGFKIFIPLRPSQLKKAFFLNAGNQSHCTSDGNIESTDRMLVLSSNYSSCGTAMSDDEDRILFHNVIVVEHAERQPFEVEDNSIIERMTFSMIPVVCSYYRMEQFSFLQTSDLQPAAVRKMKTPLTAVRNAQVRVEIVNAVASALNNLFSFDVFAEAISDNRISLMMESLYATPTNNSQDSKRYDIIVNGCYRDPSLQATPLPDRPGNRFQMAPFKFRNSTSNEIYLHGHIVLCNNFSEKCAFECKERQAVKKAAMKKGMDVIKYSKDSILKNLELLRKR